jgi:hypothetical protein
MNFILATIVTNFSNHFHKLDDSIKWMLRKHGGREWHGCMYDVDAKPQTAQQHTHRHKIHKPNTDSRSSAQGLMAGFCEHIMRFQAS